MIQSWFPREISISLICAVLVKVIDVLLYGVALDGGRLAVIAFSGGRH